VTETWLSQELFDKLKAELDELTGPIREEIKRRIAAAREEGDLKENGGYHAAREEQGKNEARIKQLASMLEHARIGTPPSDGKVAQGMIVVVHFADRAEDDADREMQFLLGTREQAPHLPEDTRVFSHTSPLGAAVLGLEVGAETSFTTPSGATRPVRVVDARPHA
jgi:transcription elongation factor GreA